MGYGRFGYRKKFNEDLEQTTVKIPHTFWIGNSHTSKDYSMNFFSEQGIMKGKLKLWNMWCVTQVQIQEQLAFLFPSKEPRSKFARSNFKPFKKAPQFPVRIYIPLSENMPKFGYAGFTIPFTIPLDDLPEESLKFLCATKSQDYGNYLSEYITFNHRGMTFPDLKLKMAKTDNEKLVMEKGFDLEEWIQSHKSNYGVQQFLMKRLSILDKEGVGANKSYKYDLEKFIKKEVLDQETVVILYLGAIKNEMLRKFIYSYFFETVKKVLSDKGGERFHYKQIFRHNEIETFSSPTGGKGSTPFDALTNDYLKRQASTIRHYGGILWGDCKSPKFVDDSVYKIFENRYVTRVADVREMRLLSEYSNDLKESEIRKYMNQIKRKKKFRFIDLDDKKIPKWFSGEQLQMGYELFAPRICFDGKVSMKNNNFTNLNGVPTYKLLGLPFDDKIDFSEIKHDLKTFLKKKEVPLLKYAQKIIDDKNRDKSLEKKQDSESMFLEGLERIYSFDKDSLEKRGKHLTKKDMIAKVKFGRSSFYDNFIPFVKELFEKKDERILEFYDWIEEVFF